MDGRLVQIGQVSALGLRAKTATGPGKKLAHSGHALF